MAWLTNTKVVALWSSYHPSNVHARIGGAWRKFEDTNDDACTNFAVLGAHAKDGDRRVAVRVESGRVKEMYVW